MNLSKNLTLEEVVKSNTAEAKGIDNSKMSDEVLENLISIATNVFQPLRDAVGAIKISSGYRSPALNAAIGGSNKSQHTKGQALDLQGIHTSNAALFDIIKSRLVFDQLIWEFGTKSNPDWVHVSFKNDGNNRNQILVSKKVNGKTIYEEIK